MEKKLLLQELSDCIAARERITKKKAEAFIRAFFEVIEEGLLTDNFVKIKGFGTFKLIAVSERESVNINTGERFQIDGHSKISFTPDNNLKDLVNRPFSHFQTVVINDETNIEELESVEDEPMLIAPEEDSLEIEEFESHQDVLQKAEDKEEAEKEATPIVVATVETPKAITIPTITEEETEEVLTNMEKEIPFEIYQPSDEEENLPTPAQNVEETGVEQKNNIPTPTKEVSEVSEETATETETKNCNAENKDALEDDSDKCEDEGCEGEEDKCTWWKKLLIILGILLLMTGSYFAGYYRLLCPCDLRPSTEETAQPQKGAQASAPLQVEQDSLQMQPQQGLQEKQSEAPDAMPQSNKPDAGNTQPESVTIQKKIESSKNVPQALPDSQVKGGRYIITGTRQEYTISRGETLRTIAEKIYGSRGYAVYIITHNNIQNPDHVDVGTVIKLPELERAKK